MRQGQRAMTKRVSLLIWMVIVALPGCAVTIGSQSGGGGNRGIEQDINSTRDNGPTAGNLEAPVSDQTAVPAAQPPVRP